MCETVLGVLQTRTASLRRTPRALAFLLRALAGTMAVQSMGRSAIIRPQALTLSRSLAGHFLALKA